MWFFTESVQLLSHIRLCDPMNCSTPGLPVHHQLLEFTQTHVHWVGDAIQPSHPLSSPSPPTLNLSQHQGLFKWVSSEYCIIKEKLYWKITYLKMHSIVMSFNLFFFPPVSLRCSWHTVLHQFKVYSIVIWLTYVSWNDYCSKVSKHSSSHMESKLQVKKNFFFLMV